MAQLINNAIMAGGSGAFGNQFVLRQRNGKTFICQMPRPSAKLPTLGQLANRARFAYANEYAKKVVTDPALKAVYGATAKPGQTAYTRAFADAFHAPEVHGVRREGNLLLVNARDDFQVVRVQVTILNEWGFEEEYGDAVHRPGSFWWEYRMKTGGTGSNIRVRVADFAGNWSERVVAV